MSNKYYNFEGDDRDYVSVTTFLGVINKPFLMPWCAKMERELIRKLLEQGYDAEVLIKNLKEYLAPKQPYGYKLYTEVAADWGSKIHKAIDYTLKDLKLPKLTKDERKVYDKWKEWWNAQNFKLLSAERRVKCSRHGYAGTLDALVVRDEGKIVIDWKTGKNTYPEHSLQNFAYQKALIEEGEGVDDGGLLVYIPKDKEIYSNIVLKVTDELFQPVLDALGLWRWVNNKPWNNNGGKK